MFEIILTGIKFMMKGCKGEIAITQVAEAEGVRVTAYLEKNCDQGFASAENLAILHLLRKLRSKGIINAENTSSRLIDVVSRYGEVSGCKVLRIPWCFEKGEHNIILKKKKVTIWVDLTNNKGGP